MNIKPNISDPYRKGVSARHGFQTPVTSIPPWVKSVRENNAIQHHRQTNAALYPQPQVLPAKSFPQQNTNIVTTRAMFYGSVNPPVVKSGQATPRIISLNEVPRFNVVRPNQFIQPIVSKQIISHPTIHVLQAPGVVKIHPASLNQTPQVVQQQQVPVIPYSASQIATTTNSHNFNQGQWQSTDARTENTYNSQQYPPKDGSHSKFDWDRQQNTASRNDPYHQINYSSQGEQHHGQQSTRNFAFKDQKESTDKTENEYNNYNPTKERAKDTAQDQQRTIRNDYSYHNKPPGIERERETNFRDSESIARNNGSYHNKYADPDRAMEMSNYGAKTQQQAAVRSGYYSHDKHFSNHGKTTETVNFQAGATIYQKNTDNPYWEKHDRQKETSSVTSRDHNIRSNVTKTDYTYQTKQDQQYKVHDRPSLYDEQKKQNIIVNPKFYGHQSNEGNLYTNMESNRDQVSLRNEYKNFPQYSYPPIMQAVASETSSMTTAPPNKINSILKNNKNQYETNQETYQKEAQKTDYSQANLYGESYLKDFSCASNPKQVDERVFNKQNLFNQKNSKQNISRGSTSDLRPAVATPFLWKKKDSSNEQSNVIQNVSDQSKDSSESSIGMFHVCVCKTTEEEMAHANYFVKAYNFQDLLSYMSDPMIRTLQRERSLHLKGLDSKLKNDYGASNFHNYSKKFFNTLVEDYCRANNIDISQLRSKDREIEKEKRDKVFLNETKKNAGNQNKAENQIKKRERISKEDARIPWAYLDVAHEMSYDKFQKLFDLRTKLFLQLWKEKKMQKSKALKESRPYLNDLMMKFCKERKINPENLKCKTTFSEAKSMVKWPSLLDTETINKDQEDVQNVRYYKKHLRTIIPFDVMKDLEGDKESLLQQLQRENSRLPERERKWGTAIVYVANRYFRDLLEAFLNKNNFSMYYFIQINDKKQKLLEKRRKEKAALKEEMDEVNWYDVDDGSDEEVEVVEEIPEEDPEEREFWSVEKSTERETSNVNDGLTLDDLPNDYKYRYYNFEEVKMIVNSQKRFKQLNLQMNKYLSQLSGKPGSKYNPELPDNATNDDILNQNLTNVKYYELLKYECDKMGVPLSELDRINLEHYRKNGDKRKVTGTKESQSRQPPGEEIALFGGTSNPSSPSQVKKEKRKLWYFDQNSKAKIHKKNVEKTHSANVQKYNNAVKANKHHQEETSTIEQEETSIATHEETSTATQEEISTATQEEQIEYYTLGILPKDIHIEYQAKKIHYYQKKIQQFGEAESVKQHWKNRSVQYFNELVEIYCSKHNIKLTDVIRNGCFKDEIKKTYKRHHENYDIATTDEGNAKRSKLKKSEEQPNRQKLSTNNTNIELSAGILLVDNPKPISKEECKVEGIQYTYGMDINVYPRSKQPFTHRMIAYSLNEMRGLIPDEVIEECKQKQRIYENRKNEMVKYSSDDTQKAVRKDAMIYFNELIENYCRENNIDMQLFSENRRVRNKIRSDYRQPIQIGFIEDSNDSNQINNDHSKDFGENQSSEIIDQGMTNLVGDEVYDAAYGPPSNQRKHRPPQRTQPQREVMESDKTVHKPIKFGKGVPLKKHNQPFQKEVELPVKKVFPAAQKDKSAKLSQLQKVEKFPIKDEITLSQEEDTGTPEESNDEITDSKESDKAKELELEAKNEKIRLKRSEKEQAYTEKASESSGKARFTSWF